MTNIFEPDIQLHNGSRTASPHITAFISELIPKLTVLYQIGSNTLESSNSHIHLRGLYFVQCFSFIYFYGYILSTGYCVVCRWISWGECWCGGKHTAEDTGEQWGAGRGSSDIKDRCVISVWQKRLVTVWFDISSPVSQPSLHYSDYLQVNQH